MYITCMRLLGWKYDSAFATPAFEVCKAEQLLGMLELSIFLQSIVKTHY